IVGALGGVAEAERPLLERPEVRSVEVLARLLDHAAALERVKQAERHALRQVAARRDLTQWQRFAGGSERRQQLRGVHDGLHEVTVRGTGPAVHGRALSSSVSGRATDLSPCEMTS